VIGSECDAVISLAAVDKALMCEHSAPARRAASADISWNNQAPLLTM